MTEKCKICDKSFRTVQGKHYHDTVCHGPMDQRIIPWNKGIKGTVSWSKGLTAETDNRIKKRGKAWNSGLTSEQDSRIKGCVHTDGSKKRIAIKMRGNQNSRHRGDRQYFYNGIRMDSTWEVKVAKYLDDHRISYQYGKITFPLDERHSYTPDFVLENGLVIEVKGFWRRENLLKFENWKILYPNIKYEIWDKHKMEELNLI